MKQYGLNFKYFSGDLRISVSLMNQEARQGERVKFSCQVVTQDHSDRDIVHIRWKFKDSSLKAPSSRFTILDKGRTLLITDVQKNDAGDYTCIGSLRGKKYKSTANLKVISKYKTHFKCKNLNKIAIFFNDKY